MIRYITDSECCPWPQPWPSPAPTTNNSHRQYYLRIPADPAAP